MAAKIKRYFCIKVYSLHLCLPVSSSNNKSRISVERKVGRDIFRGVKTYVNRRPPGFWKVPPHPVIVLNEEESDDWHKGNRSVRAEARERAARTLERHGYYQRVAICDESGAELQVINRND